MSGPTDDLRDRLLSDIGMMPADKLPLVEAFLAGLECGDLSPLSTARPKGQDTVRRVQGKKSGDKSPQSKRSGDKSPESIVIPKDWPHAPLHRIGEHGVYMVTAGTLHKEHFFGSRSSLQTLHDMLLRLADQYEWRLEAWAVFSNHYHFVAQSPADPTSLRTFLTHLHADSARAINRLDDTPGRQVWFNYWDTQLTYERSYLARLNYVHQNAVRHGLVLVANQYPWCSAAWFERTATPAQVKTIYGFKTDRTRVVDEFEVLAVEVG